jgi:hypothetical protein
MAARTPYRLPSLLLFLALLSACDGTTKVNVPPVANAGPDISADVGELVHLNGTGSDADGDNLSYSWAFVSRPAGSSASLSGATSTSASFTPDVGGQYVLSFTVSDGKASASDECTVSVNSPPTANAGSDQNVTVGEVVQLNGGGSSDPDGNNLSYSWTMVSRPAGSAATLQNATSATPSFTADVGGTYVLRLIVNDGRLSSEPDDCTILANTPPIANAGPDQQVALGALVQLSGAGSSDPDGSSGAVGVSGASTTALTYLWSFDSRPAGSTATLSSSTVVNPTFTADVEGTFVVRLVVSDGMASSAPDLVTITVTQPQTPLFLNYLSSELVLSNQRVSSGSIRVTLYGSGNSIDFPATLGSALNGTNYGFSIWLGSGTGPGQTGTWMATILIEHGGAETTLATHTFSVPYNSNFIEYTAAVTGIPGGVAGDQVILRITMTGVTQGGILFGVSPVDSHILVPGTVTVSQVSSSPEASVGEEADVKVEVHAASSLRYSGG